MIEILHCDKDIVVIVKPVGLISEDGKQGESVFGEILDSIGNLYGERGELYPIHRLDRGVGGVMVYARNKKAAASLSKEVACGNLEKTYFAIIEGKSENEFGEYRDLLFKDGKTGKSYVTNRMRKGVKEAVLTYTSLTENGGYTLVRITLETGRSHQIRVQFSSRKTPLAGDGKYGGHGGGNIALFAAELSFLHPANRKAMTFSAKPSDGRWVELFPKYFGTADAKTGGGENLTN